jgi:transposase
MPRKRVHMRKIREVLRLKLELKLSDRDTAQSCKLSRSTVGEYVHRARAASITWPLPPEMDDHTLDKLLFKQAYNKSSAPDRSDDPDRSETQTENPIAASTPDWNLVHAELQRKGVTRLLLWREYKWR